MNTSSQPTAAGPAGSNPPSLDAGYSWAEEWADQDHGDRHWSHHGLALTATGDVIGFDTESSHVIIFERSGHLKASWASGLTEAHGITTVEHEGREAVWIADPGLILSPDSHGDYSPAGAGPQAVLFDLDGTRLRTLNRPDCPEYVAGGPYIPTSVAVDEPRHGGSGDVWLADGYGSSLVHRFDTDGHHLLTMDGTTGAGRFSCPHALFVDRRQEQPRLYVADRGNARLQIFAMDGAYLGVVEAGLNSPSALASRDDWLFVAELNARVAVLDIHDRLIGYLGENGDVVNRPGWPNALDAAGKAVRPPLTPGRLNSPHGLCVHPDGTVFVAEWLIGGRLPRLSPVTDSERTS